MRIRMLLLIIALVLLAGCGNNVNNENAAIHAKNETLTSLKAAATTKASAPDPIEDLGGIYGLALDAFMPLWDGITENMVYIAIELSKLSDLSEVDKEKVMQHFDKYGVHVMDTTLDQLKEEGLVKEAGSLEGVLLRIKSSEFEGNKLTLEGSIYKSAKAALGTLVVVEYLDGQWQVTKASSTWIS